MTALDNKIVRVGPFPESIRPPRAAYIHVPFCAHKCGYCNFTVAAGQEHRIEPYLKALALELSRLGAPQPVDTLYFGGGTPTHLPPAALEQLFEIVLQWHPLADGYELTVEANPNDLDAACTRVLAAHGVNRISLGAQSFADEKLRRLERDHRARDIRRAADSVRLIGADLSIDLIFAAPNVADNARGSAIGNAIANARWPGERLSEWQNDLNHAIALQPDHVSVYGLTIERGSAFFGRRRRGVLTEVEEESQRAMYLAAIESLTGAGFEHYEVSNFARPNKRSRHNQVYWRGDAYFAAGPGAARFVGGHRESNHGSTTTDIRRVLAGASPVVERETLPAESRARELLVFSLRRIDGIAREEFFRHTRFEIDSLAGKKIAKFVSLGLLEDDGNRIWLTREGLLVSDAMWPDLL